jgi:hypothetical protein
MTRFSYESPDKLRVCVFCDNALATLNSPNWVYIVFVAQHTCTSWFVSGYRVPREKTDVACTFKDLPINI